jgi:hypothetical protein
MEHKSEGFCRFCLKIFSGAGMGRHLSTCKTREEKNELELKGGRKKYKIYHLSVKYQHIADPTLMAKNVRTSLTLR